MLSFPIFVYLLSTLATTAYPFIVNFNCNQGSEKQDVDNAIMDVEEVAKAAVEALTSSKINGKEDVFKSAYDPLMYPADQPGLLATFTTLANLGRSTTLVVQIYCRENHIRYHKNDPKSYWEDKDFYSKINNKPMAVGVAANSKDKPGTKGSYATLGYKFSDEYDCSGHAHIYLAVNRLHPPTGTNRDLRRYPVIVKDGLDGKHNQIEDIKPLAQTLLHELLHAIGGRPPDPKTRKRRELINDGPSGAKVYGWAHCNSRRIQNQRNNDLADCITFLAQAIYLQFQGKDTYWAMGAVDPKTLRPQHIS